jgi:hypothetical protein
MDEIHGCNGNLKSYNYRPQVHNHFPDFDTDPLMMEYLEKFEVILEREKMNGQLRMLNFACAEKVRWLRNRSID